MLGSVAVLAFKKPPHPGLSHGLVPQSKAVGQQWHQHATKAMQLIQLERDDWNFFCPSTGQPVFKDTGEPNASTVRGFWCHEVPDEPELLSEELQAQWAAHVAIQDAADEGVDVVAFLKSVDKPGWVAFEITSCGMACGPVCNTTWTVLDLS